MIWTAAAWLDALLVPSRIRRWTLLAFFLQLGALLVIVLGTHGLLVKPSHPTTTDFASFYAAGRLADGTTPFLVYDRAAHYAAEQRATEPGIGYVFFFYPPVFLLFCGLLARLPYLVAFLLLEGMTAAALLVLLRRIAGIQNWWSLLAALSFSPLIWNIGIGQNACLTASLFGGATLLLQARRPVAAGLLFACLCYKPHFGLLIPIALAASGDWRAIAACLLGGLALLCASVALYGMASWTGFLHALAQAQGEFAAGRVVPWTPMVSIYGAARLIGAGARPAYIAEAIVAIVVIGCTIWSWRRPDDGTGIRYAVLASGTLLIVPVVLFYDLLLLLVAAAWLIRAAPHGKLARHERLGLAAMWLAVLFCYPAAGAVHVPIGAICNVGLFTMAIVRQSKNRQHLPNVNTTASLLVRKDEPVLLVCQQPTRLC